MRFYGKMVGLLGCLLVAAVTGCDRGQNGQAAPSTQQSNVAWDEARSNPVDPSTGLSNDSEDVGKKHADELRVLFIGNSHSAPIPRLLTKLFRKHQPKTKTKIQTARSFGFLVDHAKVPATRKLIQSGEWDYVVLQAQKYSTSGKYTYPTDGAIQLSELANQAGAKIIMYPEWSRAGVPDEYIRIKDIHNAIARQTGAQVAPIGEAWQEAGKSLDPKRLYAPDGNHATEKGSYLNACVFYSMITKQRPASKKGSSSAETRVLENAAWTAYQASRKPASTDDNSPDQPDSGETDR